MKKSGRSGPADSLSLNPIKSARGTRQIRCSPDNCPGRGQGPGRGLEKLRGQAGLGQGGQARGLGGASGEGQASQVGPGRGGQARGAARPGGRDTRLRGSYSSDWLACLSHAPAPEPVLGLLRCACRASSEPTSLTLRHARCCYSQRPQLAPV